LVFAVLAAVAHAGDEIPFPVRKSTTASRDGATYVVEGHQRIDKGVTINCKQNIRIVGRGENPTLEIAGSLIIEGQPHQEVEIENLRIAPSDQFFEIRIEWTNIAGGSIATMTDGADGKFSLDCAKVQAPVDITFRDGRIRILTSEFRGPVLIKGAPDGKSGSKVKIDINHCCGKDTDKQLDLKAGFFAGLRIERAPSVLLRGSWLTGGSYEFEDCEKLTFDGNTVVMAQTAFRQTSAGKFRRTKVTKCDFHDGKVTFHAPAGSRADKVIVEKCWFAGMTDDDDIRAKMVQDGTGNEECGVKVVLRKTNERPLGIGGSPR
jgi:hypothetical protein